MADYTAADVKRLRELTGSGMLDCKNALASNGGDFDKAVEALRIKGAKDVGKRAERACTGDAERRLHRCPYPAHALRGRGYLALGPSHGRRDLVRLHRDRYLQVRDRAHAAFPLWISRMPSAMESEIMRFAFARPYCAARHR